MISTYASALNAAQEAAGGQNYPPGALYVVATPIGNLADITLRALQVLKIADVVACEDTRHTQSMLRAYGIDKPTSQLLAVHQHNEAEAAQAVIARLHQGLRVAYVSDAGTPAISDPGARLVAAVRGVGLRALPLPGASSVTTTLCVAGITDLGADQGSFVFAGFLPPKSTERIAAVAGLVSETRAVVLLEAPHRIEALATALAALGERTVTVGRELTKQFEDIANLAAQDFPAWLKADPNRCRGEFVLVLHPVRAAVEVGPEHRILKLLLEELPLKTAVKLTADITGASRNTLYDTALAWKKESTEE